MKISSSSKKQEEKLDLAARAAWLYYVAGNTQHELARKLKISRPTAQRLVAIALERGIVKVQVHHKVTCCLEVATMLRKRYGLVVCEVVPSNEDSTDQVLRKIAVRRRPDHGKLPERTAAKNCRAKLWPDDEGGDR